MNDICTMNDCSQNTDFVPAFFGLKTHFPPNLSATNIWSGLISLSEKLWYFLACFWSDQECSRLERPFPLSGIGSTIHSQGLCVFSWCLCQDMCDDAFFSTRENNDHNWLKTQTKTFKFLMVIHRFITTVCHLVKMQLLFKNYVMCILWTQGGLYGPVQT